MIVNIRAAKTQLSKLIARAEAGEEVIIARAGKPAVRLTPLEVKPRTDPGARRALPDWLGSMRGQIKLLPGWDEPDLEMIHQMEDGEIFPPAD